MLRHVRGEFHISVSISKFYPCPAVLAHLHVAPGCLCLQAGAEVSSWAERQAHQFFLCLQSKFTSPVAFSPTHTHILLSEIGGLYVHKDRRSPEDLKENQSSSYLWL